jgi:hypothetical protein
MVADGLDPVAEKKAAKAVKEAETVEHKAELERAAETFEKAAWAWFEDWRKDKATSNVCRIMGRLEKDVLP